MIQSEVIFLCSKVRHARLICPPGFFWFFGCWFYFLRRYDELRVSHENAKNCESLGGREEQTYGHISHLMSKKMQLLREATLTGKNTTSLYTLYFN